MKTRLVFLALLIVCFSCGTNNKPVSDAQKEKIKGEVKGVLNTFYKGCDEVNFDMVTETFLNSPDYVYTYNGVSYSYKELLDALKTLYTPLLNQKGTITDEKYSILDNSTVIYTSNNKTLRNFKDGHTTSIDPDALLFVFKKINGKWGIIHAFESCVEKIVPSKTSKELNQVELMKQMIGSWRGDIAKDTTFFAECKSYGITGLEWTYKYVTKGKIVEEGKQFWGYDKKVDKLIFSSMDKGGDMGMYVSWFLSKNKYIYLPYSDISNLETASFKIEGEIKSPDMIVETTFINNKPIVTYTYTRVK